MMTKDKKDLQVEFAPGCFDSFEGTQEELDALQKEILEMFANSTPEEIAEMARPMSEEDFNDLPDDIKAQLLDFDPDSDELPTNHKRNLQ